MKPVSRVLVQVQSLMTNAERYSLSAAVFTALTDVELEIDGLMSYDRAVIKMGAQPLHQIHSQLIQASHVLNQGPVGEKHCTCRSILMRIVVCVCVCVCVFLCLCVCAWDLPNCMHPHDYQCMWAVA